MVGEMDPVVAIILQDSADVVGEAVAEAMVLEVMGMEVMVMVVQWVT